MSLTIFLYGIPIEQFTAIIETCGSGKLTLLNLAFNGQIYVNDHKWLLTQLASFYKKIRLYFSELPLLKSLPVCHRHVFVRQE